MPLDGAEFIAELSIIDPPGTDPLNQGDDHIRTIKKAVQQSFPNVGSAVPQTGAQMAQMAIKNEVNIFTNFNQFAQGSGPAPAITSNVDTTTGIHWTTGLVGIATSGATRFTVEASRIRFLPPLRPDVDGTEGAPQYSFFNEPSTGMYRQGASQLGFAVAGAERFRISNTNVTLRPGMLQFRNITGTAAVPAYSFNDNTNMGMYREAGDTMAFSVGGVRQSRVFTTFWQFFQPILGPSGTAADPSFGITGAAGMGMYEAGTDILSLAVASAPRFATGLGFSQLYQNTPTGGAALNFSRSNGIVGYSWQYEGTAGFQPDQFSLSRFNRTTGAFIDIPLYINATTGRVHSALPILSP